MPVTVVDVRLWFGKRVNLSIFVSWILWTQFCAMHMPITVFQDPPIYSLIRLARHRITRLTT